MTLRRNGSGVIREGSKTIDSQNIRHKLYLREMATSGLRERNVLDLFAGKKEIWSRLEHSTYLGVDKKKVKADGVIRADNRKVIPTLDLSKFNVIDLDSYGIPSEQIGLLFENGTIRGGTVVIYTLITNKLVVMPNNLREYAEIRDMYHKASTLFCGHNETLFYDWLASMGVKLVREYSEPSSQYSKRYGYFVV